MTKQSLNILLVDDDEIDRLGVQRALKRCDMPHQLTMAENGVEALEKLRGAAPPVEGSEKTIVLLDLNMPRMSGLEFLAELRKDSALSNTLVFVLTTSENQRDVSSAYELGIAGYFAKSNLDSNFANLLAMLDLYVSLVTFP